MRTVTIAVAAAILAGGQGRGPASAGAPAPEGPVLERHVRVFDGQGDEITLPELLDALAGVNAVFLGETHLDETTHDVELAVLTGLASRRGDRVVLAMEMFGTDVQDAIDEYLAGRIDETRFLEHTRPWRNYRTGYRALVETARKRGLPVVGSNIPADLRRRISQGGAEAFEALGEDERRLVPPQLHPNGVEYWKRFERAVAGHMGRDDAPAEPDPRAYLYSAQSLWDNTMGWSCARVLRALPDHVVVHVNGGFHSRYGQGTVEQFLLRAPEATVATVAIIPTADLSRLDTRLAGRAADYLVFAEARARGIQDGFHAVETSRETRYRVHVPGSLPPRGAAPVLIWLCEDGLRAADAEAYWVAAIGDEAVIVTVEPTYIQLADDLHLAGRWYWPETFHDDLGATVQALERVFEYVGRHFPVDTFRIVVAGAGTGATIVASAAIESDRLPVPMLAIEPRDDGKLVERSLPDLPPATEGLVIAPAAGDVDRWSGRAAGYRAAGLDAEVVELAGDAYHEAERRVRAELGLGPSPVTPDRTGAATGTSALARHWARLAAQRRARDGAAAAAGAAPRIEVADFADAEALPVPAGPFGGTTLLVVPAGAPDEDRQAWLAIAGSDAMHRAHGRFHRLVVAFHDASPGPEEALEELAARGRTNVLIVPAVFHAGPAEMRRLRDRVAGQAEGMTVTFLPGLGGQWAGAD